MCNMLTANTRRSRPNWRRVGARAINYGLVAFSLMLVSGAMWIRYRFGDVSFEQILVNLPIDGGGGEGVGNNTYITEVLVFCILLPAALTALGALLLSLWRTRRLPRAPSGPGQPARHRRVRRFAILAPVVAFVAALSVFLTVAGVPQYAVASLDNRSVAGYYVTPTLQPGAESTRMSSVSTSSATPKNLITIYLESIENTFEDESLFGENLLASLDTATADWSRYDGLTQYYGGGWTMAGLVSTQCGVPLKSKILSTGVDPNVYGESVQQYLPGATCLGDVLNDQGYTSVFLGGAASGFAGKSTFLLGHGYSVDRGLADWQAAGEDPAEISSQWGLSDYRLFQNAKQTVSDLASGESPFNLTLLTLDSHEPGQSYPSCAVPDGATLADSIKCSVSAVSDFISYLSDSGILDDTVVVIMGDHLKPTSDGNQFRGELTSVSNRTIVFRVWDPDGPVDFTRESADQLSVMPSVLSILDLPVVDGRAGLGVAFVGDSDTQGSLLELPTADYDTLLTVPSNDLYRRLWNLEE